MALMGHLVYLVLTVLMALMGQMVYLVLMVLMV